MPCSRIKDYFFPAQPVAVASRVTAGDAAAARQDCYAEERRAAILRQQERLEAETAQKMAEQKALEEAMRERRLAALDEEARKFGMQTERCAELAPQHRQPRLPTCPQSATAMERQSLHDTSPLNATRCYAVLAEGKHWVGRTNPAGSTRQPPALCPECPPGLPLPPGAYMKAAFV